MARIRRSAQAGDAGVGRAAVVRSPPASGAQTTFTNTVPALLGFLDLTTNWECRSFERRA